MAVHVKTKIAMILGTVGTILVLVLGVINMLPWDVVAVLATVFIGVTGLLFRYWSPEEDRRDIHQGSKKNIKPMKSQAIFGNVEYREVLSDVAKSLESGDEFCGIARIPFIGLTENIVEKFSEKSSIADDAYNFTHNLIEAMKRGVKVRYLLDIRYTKRMLHKYLDLKTTKEFIEQLEWVLGKFKQLEILPLFEEQQSSNFLVSHGRNNHVFEYLKDPEGNFIFATHDEGNVPTEWYSRFFQHLWDYSKNRSETIIAVGPVQSELRFLVVALLRRTLHISKT